MGRIGAIYPSRTTQAYVRFVYLAVLCHGHTPSFSSITEFDGSAPFSFYLRKSIHFASKRIRAVYMNGSRTNPNAPKDIFHDYDIVYVVTETASFIKDEKWKTIFGDLLMIQEPDKLDQGIGMDMDFDRSYGYLMLFTDGNRIDLHIETKESMMDGYVSDKLTIPLLDKDNCLPSKGSRYFHDME